MNKGFALKSDSTKILKQTSDNEPIVSLFEAFTTKPNIPFYKINGIESNEQYTFPERRSLFSGVDTICMIHTITYETKLKTRARSVNAKAIENLILIQNWYWDDVKKEVQIWLRATAPLIEYKDNDSERQYSGNFDKPSFFYRRTDD